VLSILLQVHGARPYQKPVLNREKLLWCIVCFQILVRLFQICVGSGDMWSVLNIVNIISKSKYLNIKMLKKNHISC